MADERRDSFRIDDKVHLEYRVLSEDEYQRLLAQPIDELEESSLVGQLRDLTAQAGNLLITIRKADPDVAHYLALLDRKIELVASQLEGTRAGRPLTPDTRVNMSAGGMGLWRDQPLALGTKLDLHLMVFPSHLRVHALGEVVHAEEDPQAPAHSRFRIGVLFTRLPESDKDALVRHLIERQSAQLRRQRGR
ncbi:MAG: PilZ domain-containing protein [Gammaproteobacteria bacterium]|nr:PilZ domain-containing protein [Gammaproteobacteria bacterium]